MKTVHIILNAHLDPIWLWSWRAGLDEVLNTSYYLCGLLDRHPDIVYTRGEAWLYEQIQRVDPELFERVKRHVAAGRWSVVGGWYIQPDCNLPTGEGMRRQFALGREFFQREFNFFPTTGYNVDSFGHAASLPGLMRAAGQSSYVMMRPQPHEMTLPARLFRWRGYADGPEVTTFRISEAYCTAETGIEEKNIRAALAELPEGVSHTMFFAGIGDHGGGPTESIIDWCRTHRDKFDGVRLEFSSPARFFEAVRAEAAQLPVVTGELQMHAVGCFTVHRSVKLRLKQAEHRLPQAESLVQKQIATDPKLAAQLEAAWKRVCFHQFHDTMGGTCLPTAFEDVDHQLGEALATADEIATYALRKKIAALPDSPAQRFVFHNASAERFDDFVEIEPWLEWSEWQPSWRVVDEKDRPVAFQRMAPECGWDWLTRLFIPLRIDPSETRVLRLVEAGAAAEAESTGATATESSLTSPAGVAVQVGAAASLRLPGFETLPLPVIASYEDLSDTWSHGVARYERKKKETVIWETAEVVDRGPLMASLVQRGRIGRSEAQVEWRVYRDQPWLDALVRIVWNERRRILKYEWDFPGKISEREDGIMDGSLVRPLNGYESPLRDWVRLRVAGRDVGILAPDVFAVDATPETVGFSLLRSSPLACHDPLPDQPATPHVRSVYADRGEHFFRFRFLSAERLAPARLENLVSAWNKPPLSAETTRGMKNRAMRRAYQPPPLGAA